MSKKTKADFTPQARGSAENSIIKHLSVHRHDDNFAEHELKKPNKSLSRAGSALRVEEYARRAFAGERIFSDSDNLIAEDPKPKHVRYQESIDLLGVKSWKERNKGTK